MFGSKVSVLEPGHKKLDIKLKDVAGLHEAKIEISEFIDYLKNPQKYTVVNFLGLFFLETRSKTP